MPSQYQNGRKIAIISRPYDNLNAISISSFFSTQSQCHLNFKKTIEDFRNIISRNNIAISWYFENLQSPHNIQSQSHWDYANPGIYFRERVFIFTDCGHICEHICEHWTHLRTHLWAHSRTRVPLLLMQNRPILERWAPGRTGGRDFDNVSQNTLPLSPSALVARS